MDEKFLLNVNGKHNNNDDDDDDKLSKQLLK